MRRYAGPSIGEFAGSHARDYDDRNKGGKNNTAIVPVRRGSLDDVATSNTTKGKLPLPGHIEDKLRRKIASAGLNQKQLAKKAGVAAPTVDRIWKGEASWESILKVFAAVEWEAPLIVDSESFPGKLEAWRLSGDPRYTKMLEHYAAESDPPAAKVAAPASGAPRRPADKRRKTRSINGQHS